MILSQVDGCSLPVKILPKSSINKIVGWEGENLKIKICSAPEDGKANAALVLFLSKALDVPKAHIEITHGQTSRIKKIKFTGVTKELLEKKVSYVLSN